MRSSSCTETESVTGWGVVESIQPHLRSFGSGSWSLSDAHLAVCVAMTEFFQSCKRLPKRQAADIDEKRAKDALARRWDRLLAEKASVNSELSSTYSGIFAAWEMEEDETHLAVCVAVTDFFQSCKRPQKRQAPNTDDKRAEDASHNPEIVCWERKRQWTQNCRLRTVASLLLERWKRMKLILLFVWQWLIFPEWSECVARVPVSLWRSGGWGCLRSTWRLRSQPFATVRNRSREVAMAVPMASKRGHFWRFQTSRSFVSRGRRGSSWHWDVFHNVSKDVACALLLSRFQKMSCIFRGRCNTLDVSCGSFFANGLAGLHQVVTWCKFRGRRGIWWDVLKIDGSLARNIGFEVANFAPRGTS